MAAAKFGELPLGARFHCDGERYTKMEHELREGMLQCSNAVSDGGRWTLFEPDQEVQAAEVFSAGQEKG